MQRAQQPGLSLKRHVADLVQKQCAAIGLLKLPCVARHGSGEGALFVPEQLAFDQFGRNRGSIDRYERPILALT